MATKVDTNYDQYHVEQYLDQLESATNNLIVLLRNAWMFYDEKKHPSASDTACTLFMEFGKFQEIVSDDDFKGYLTKIQSIPMKAINRPIY